MSRVAQEELDTATAFKRVETLESIADTLPEDDERRIELMQVASGLIIEVGPVRPRVAATLLGLNEKTVRSWTSEGVLVSVEEEPRLLLDPIRLHEVKHVMTDLRVAGKTRGLLDAVSQRLADQALLDNDEVQQSLDEMRRGKGKVVRANPHASA